MGLTFILNVHLLGQPITLLDLPGPFPVEHPKVRIDFPFPGLDLSFCSKVEYSFQYTTNPAGWAGSGNLDAAGECDSFGEPCIPDINRAGEGGCFDCWDFLFSEFKNNGNVVDFQLLGNGPSPASGTVFYQSTCRTDLGNGELLIGAQTNSISENEIITISNIMVLCYQKPSVEPEITVFDANVCVGEPIILFEKTGYPYSSYIWRLPNTSIVSGPEVIIEESQLSDDGNYRLTVIDEAGCEYELDVNINVYDEIFVDLIEREDQLCQGDCITFEIQNTNDSGEYTFQLGVNTEEIDTTLNGTMEGNQETFQVCWTGVSEEISYDDDAKRFELPSTLQSNTVQIELISFTEIISECMATLGLTSSDFELIDNVEINNPDDYILCAETGRVATFDLTSIVSEINGNTGDSVAWFMDPMGLMEVSNPGSYVSNTNIVYARVVKGNCESNLVPLNLVVIDDQDGLIEFISIDGDVICDLDDPGESINIRLNVPNSSLDYDIEVEYNIDDAGWTSQLIQIRTFSSDLTYTYNGIESNLKIRMKEVDILDGCDFIGEIDSIEVPVINPPSIITNIDSIYACGSYILENIQIANGSGSEAYYTLSDGMGDMFMPGDTIKSDATLYAYDNNNGCVDEEQVVIDITPNTVIDTIRDTTSCDFFVLDTLTGTGDIEDALYFQGPNGTGGYYEAGDTIFNTVTLFPYDTSAACLIAQDSFKITIVGRPDLSSITDIRECEMWIIDSLGLQVDSLLFITISSQDTFRYGDTIKESAQLLVEAGNGACYASDSITVNITPQPNAGAGLSAEFCLSETDTVNLFFLLDSTIQYTSGGTWTGVNGYEGEIDSSGILDITSFAPGDYVFQYFVFDSICGQDSTLATVGLYEALDAGQDTILILCSGTVDLLSLINGDEGGSFSIIPDPGVIVDFSNPYAVSFAGADTGLYIVDYVTKNPVCMSDTASILLDIRGTVSAGTGESIGICVNSPDSIMLNSQISGLSNPNGVWESEDDPTIIISNTSSISMTGKPPGTYEFNYIVTIPICGKDTATVSIIVDPLPNAGVDSTMISCGEILNLEDIHGGDTDGYYVMSPSSGIDFSNPTAVDFTGLPVGSYEISYVDSSGICTPDTSLFSLTIIPAPNAGTGTFSITCIGTPDSIDLNGLLTGTPDMGGRWESVTNSGIQISPSSRIFLSSEVPGVYEFDYIVENSICDNDTAIVMIELVRSPYAGRDTLIRTCGDILDLTLLHGGDAGGSYGILPSVGLDFSDPMAVNTNGLPPGIYEIYYEVEDPDCNMDVATIQLEMLAFPNAGTGTTGTACTGIADSLDLAGLLTGSPDGGGRWESVDLPASVVSPTAKVELSGEAPGTYAFEYIVELPICGSDTATVMVEVIRTPDAGVDRVVTTCGEVLDFSALHGGDSGGVYSISPSVAIDFSDPTAVDVSGLQVDDYEIMYVIDGGMCPSDTSIVTLELVAFPNAGTGTTGTACTGIADSLDLAGLLTGSPDGGGRWESVDLPASVISPAAKVELSGEAPGTYAFEYIVELPICGSDTATVMVEVIRTPDAGVDRVVTTCGEVLDFSALHGGDSGGVYSISPSVTVDFSDPTAVDVSGLPVDDYEIMYVVDGGMCPADTSIVTLELVAFPNAGKGTQGTACTGIADSLDLAGLLTGSPDGGGRWESVDLPASVISPTAKVELSGEAPGTNAFEYIVELPICGSDTATVVVEVIQTPDAGVDRVVTTCGEVLDFSALHGGDSGGVYSISSSVTVDFSDPTAVDVSGLPVDDYEIMYVVDGGMCPSDTSIITLELVAFPNAGTGTTGTACTGIADSLDLAGLLTGSPDGGGRWESADLPASVISPTAKVELSGEAPGTYAFEYIVELPICGSDTATVVVEVIRTPDAGVDRVVTTCGEVLDFSALHGGDSGGVYSISPSVTVDFSDPTGVDVSDLPVDDYEIMYVVEGGMCPADTSIVTLELVAFPNAGTGTQGTACTGIADSLDLAGLLTGSPDGGGRWESVDLPASVISPTAKVELSGASPGTYAFEYIVELPICGSDTATVVVEVIRTPDAGVDRVVTTCGEVLDFLSLHGGDVGGVYSISPSVTVDFSDPTGVDVSDLPVDDYEIMYVVEGGMCPADTSIVTLELVAFPNAGTGTQGTACTGIADSLDLAGLLTGSPDGGGRWESVDLPGSVISPTAKVELSGEAPGTYAFEYIVELPICGSDTATVMIDVIQSPDAGNDNTLNTCGDIVDFTQLHNGMGGGRYLVSPPGSLDFSDPTAVDVAVLDPGNYQVTYIIDHPFCTSDTAIIELIRERTPDAGTGMDIAICEGSQDSLLLNTLLTGHDTDGSWMEVNGNNITVNSNSSIDLTTIQGGSYQFRYEVTTPSCGADFTDVTVDIISNPFAGRDTMDVICAGLIDIGSYFPGSNAGGEYSISPDQNINFNDSRNVDLSGLTNGIYIITYSINAPGCPSVNANLTLDVVSPPAAGLDTTLVRCDDPVISFSQVLRGHDAGGRIENGNRIYSINESVDLDTISDHTFLYIVDGNASCPGDTAVLTLESDVFLSAGEDVNYVDCNGAPLDLKDLLSNADPGGDFIDVNQEILPSTLVTIGQGRTVEFRYVTSSLCGSDTAEIMIENIQYSNLSLSVSDGSPCEDDCIDVNINMTGPKELVLYYNIEDDLGNRIDTNIIVDGQIPSTLRMCVSPGMTFNSGQLETDRQYVLTVDSLIYENTCQVPLNLTPVSIQSYGNRYGVLDTVVCVGESFTKGSILFTESNPSSDVLLAGMASNFCDSILTVNVTFEDEIFGSLDTSICRGEIIVINGTTYSEDLTFGQDTFPGASMAGCDSILMVHVSVFEPSMGAFSATLCDRDSTIVIGDRSFSLSDPSGIATIAGGAFNGCDSLVEVNITYLNESVAQFDTTVCDIDFIFELNGTEFNFNNRSGQVVYPAAAVNGCDSTINVNIRYDLLDVIYDVIPLVCPEDEEWRINIRGTNGVLPLNYDISGQSGSITTFPFSITVDRDSEQFILFSDSRGCERTDTLTLEIPDPILFEINSEMLNPNTYQLTIETDAILASVEWSPPLGLSCSACLDPVVNVTQELIYRVNAITSQGCQLSDSVFLSSELLTFLVIPNAFSPNGDGVNDIWYISVDEGEPITIESISIYSRWGNRVFFSEQVIVNDPQEGWDGTYKNEKLNPGVYVYQVVYENQEGERQYFTGDLTIIY